MVYSAHNRQNLLHTNAASISDYGHHMVKYFTPLAFH
jgi:hypothetical protein